MAHDRGRGEVAAEIERGLALCQDGRLSEAVSVFEDLGSSDDAVQLVHAVALFERGDVCAALDMLVRVCALRISMSSELRFESEFIRFTRESAYMPATANASKLASLRQLATAIGDSCSLSGLHLAVAKIEALRGSFLDAQTHVDIARRLADGGDSASTRSSVDLIAATLDMYAGNLAGATRAAVRSFDIATASQLRMPLAGSLANLGLLALCAGDPVRARGYLTEGQKAAGELSFVQLALADSLANVALYEGQLDECRRYLDQAQSLIAAQRVPARSWYDLAHQITRCLYLSHLEDWEGIIATVDAAHPELERRQLRVWHVSLLSAKAKAHARLSQHDAADAALLAALRRCPRGAVDPLITVEAATGTCLALRGDTGRGHRHFDRALRACEAISHRFQEWAVTRERASLPGLNAPTANVDKRRHADTEETNLILADVVATLGAGHSIDVMAQRLAAVVATTSLRSRLDVATEPVTDTESLPPVTWNTSSDGVHRIVLADTDRRISLRLREVHSLEDVSLVRHLVEIAKAAVSRSGDAHRQDDDVLWPQVTLPSGSDAVFWSPHMQEFLRIAMKLAATELPILITGETGTGKEVIARLIHANSKWARGPFVPFNAAAIQRELVESQMFGHRRGAFTGATDPSGGVIRAAEQGTLFLDEIGDLDPTVQPKFLRFLESGEIHPVGESRPIQTRVRVVAATNAELESLVSQGRFRSDLLYRLCIATLSLPPLRSRKDEIPALAALFVRKACVEAGRHGLRVGDDFIAALLLHDWPGNIRQMANEVRRVVALAEDGATLSARDLSPEITKGWMAQHQAFPDRPTGPSLQVELDQPLD